MSKAVLRQFCFGILTPKAFFFLYSFHINYCFVQIKQKMEREKQANEKKKKERKKSEYKSSRRKKKAT